MAACRPRSVTDPTVCLTGVAGFLAASHLAEKHALPGTLRLVVCLAATAAPMILLDILVRGVHRRASAGLSGGGRRHPLRWRRATVKLAGLWGTVAAVALAYWIVPEYDDPWYAPFWDLVRAAGPFVLAASIPYVVLVDAHQAEPADEYWHAGRLLLGRWRGLDWRLLRRHASNWVIKGFYLPLMTTLLARNLVDFAAWDLRAALVSVPRLVGYVSQLALAIDLAFVAIGYMLTLRVIDSHIRTPNPFVYGWVVTLALYRPFWAPLQERFFRYGSGGAWLDWMGGSPVLLASWGTLIILAKLSWVWANVSFGTRFSNLTNRGIITSGPYRFTKHPSYLAKNVSWWLLSVPFLSHEGPGAATQHVLALLGINLFYFLRARAEEAHLSEDSTYVEYAQWIEEHGALRGLGRLLPVLRYRPPAVPPPAAGGRGDRFRGGRSRGIP
ncbi:MAG: isoprenylcysteine carboxylmethyltransferase family protein [Planctomycetota bacterium]